MNEAANPDMVYVKVAEILSLLTCGESGGNYEATPELKDILVRIDARVRSVHAALPANSMLIVCTGHGDIAMVDRYANFPFVSKVTS